MKTNTSPIAVVALAMANVTDLILMYFLLHRAVFILVQFFLDKGREEGGRYEITITTTSTSSPQQQGERRRNCLEEEGGRGQGEEVPLTEEPQHATSAP